MGIANLEAMAMGVPPITTSAGGLFDAVLHGVTGLVIPIGDTKSLSEALVMLLQNEELAYNMGKNARKNVEEKFNIKNNVKKMEEAF